MAISTYAELLTAVQNYEDDATSVVSGVVGDMVTLGEQRIFYGHGQPGEPMYSPPLRCQAIESNVVIPIGPGTDAGTATGTANEIILTLSPAPTVVRGFSLTFTASLSNTTTTKISLNAEAGVLIKKGPSRDDLQEGDIVSGGRYTVYYDGTYYVLMPSDGACPLPSRFLGVRAAYLQDRGRYLSQMPDSGINRFLESATSGTPDYYAVHGGCMRFDPLPAQSQKLLLSYYAKPATLSTALNDVFREAPRIYLFASLLELALYLPNETGIGRYYSEYIGSLKAYAASDLAARQGHAPMRVRFGQAP